MGRNRKPHFPHVILRFMEDQFSMHEKGTPLMAPDDEYIFSH